MGPCKSKNPPIQSTDQEPMIQHIEPQKQQIEQFSEQKIQEKAQQELPLNNQNNGQTKDKIIDNTFADTTKMVFERKVPITQFYTLLNPPLGKGAFGEVRKAINKASGMLRAVKIIHKEAANEKELEQLKNEVAILRQLDHPHIIKVYEFFQDQNYFYIVTELCTGPELFDRIQEVQFFSEKQAAEIMTQILQSLAYCHSNNIVHRDMKPENILYDSDKSNAVLKVIDFGTSKSFDPKQKLTQRLGTPYYMAPEVIKGSYNFKCDIWSCGVILYILLCGYPPFRGRTDEQILKKVQKGTFTYDETDWHNVSMEAKKLIGKMLDVDVNKRYNAEQCLADNWIKECTQKEQLSLPLLQKTLQNVREFQNTNKLQDGIYSYIVTFLTSKEEKKELLETFKALDENGDGRLSRQELIQGYSKIMTAALAEQEVTRIMKAVDKNNSGSIDYTGSIQFCSTQIEFVIASINKSSLLSKQKLETTFKMFDADGSGSITVEELKEIFQGADDQFLISLVKEVDQNSDGQISLQEFKDLMFKLS